MKRLIFVLPALLTGIFFPPWHEVSGQDTHKTRTIHLMQDDAQVRFVSKLYTLKHVKATDILPYVFAAVTRYSKKSNVQRVTSSSGPNAPEGLLVSTGRDFMPYVDDLVARIDKPGKKDKSGSLIEGTGITRVAYTPKYRAARDFPALFQTIFASPEGSVFLDEGSNTLYWKDVHNGAMNILSWVEYLDRPLPQAEIRINYYELRESTLRDIGFDYLAWKNGPGVNFFNVGYNAGRVAVNETFRSLIAKLPAFFSNAAKFATSWGYAGFFTAPEFDMSFIRVLQQSGSAKVTAHASLVALNTPVPTMEAYHRLTELGDETPYRYTATVTPQYQTIAKTNEGRTYVGNTNDYAEMAFTVYNPIICGNGGHGLIKNPHDKPEIPDGKNGGLIFRYLAKFRNVVERGGTGNELANTVNVSGGAVLDFNTEKLLAVYEKETDVEQIIGFPFFGKLPVLKYICSTTTTIKERTYIIVTAEANLIHPQLKNKPRAAHEVDAAEIKRWKLF